MKQFYPKIQEIDLKEPDILQLERSAIVVISEQCFFLKSLIWHQNGCVIP